MVKVRRIVKHEPGGHGAVTTARTWKCEHCHGMLHAGRGQTPEGVARVHSWTCPAIPPPPQPRRP